MDRQAFVFTSCRGPEVESKKRRPGFVLFHEFRQVIRVPLPLRQGVR